jgi:hypothetical protein
MAKQRKAYRGSIYRCACGCGRSKKPKRRFAPACGAIRHFRFRTKPAYDNSKTFTNQKRGDLIIYSGAQVIAINAEARQMENSSLGAAFRRLPKAKLQDKGDF